MDWLTDMGLGGWAVFAGAILTFTWAYLSDGKEVDHTVLYKTYDGIQATVLVPRLEEQKWMWSRLPEVLDSGILEKISDRNRNFQEAMFEILSTEVSYLRSLNILITTFYEANDLTEMLGEQDKAVLFGNVAEIRDCSKNLQADLVKKWEYSFYVLELGSLMKKYAENEFRCYIEYCRNQPRQEKLQAALLANAAFETLVKRKESSVDHPLKLTMDAYLMMPMQRVTRYPLLMSAVIKLCHSQEEKVKCEEALKALSDLVKECNEAARETQDCEETKLLLQRVDLPQGHTVSSLGSFLLKSEFFHFPIESSSPTRGSGSHLNWSFRKAKPKLHLIVLYTNSLVILRKRSSGKYEVVSAIPCQNRSISVAKMAAPPTPVYPPSKDFQYYFVLQCGSEYPLNVYAAKSVEELDRWKLKLTTLNMLNNGSS